MRMTIARQVIKEGIHARLVSLNTALHTQEKLFSYDARG